MRYLPAALLVGVVAFCATFDDELNGCLGSGDLEDVLSNCQFEDIKVGNATAINLGLARRFPAGKYVKGQQVRNRAMAQFEKLLKEVDVIASPTTACTSGPISEDALAHGESDLGLLTKVMRFAVVGNLTGLPCISVPAGYDQRGMPVGFQLMGRAFEEHTLLRLGRVVEGAATPRRPKVYFDLLS